MVFFFKQKTAYDMRISDWSSDVCSSDLLTEVLEGAGLADVGMLVRILDVRDVDGEIGDVVVDAQERREAAGFQKIPRLGQRRQQRALVQIGRASCRERVCQYV